MNEKIECNHEWIKTLKPCISKEWIKLKDGRKDERYFHIYKCALCGEERRICDNDILERNNNNKIQKLIDWNEPNGEGCLVSTKVSKGEYKVGYMYREDPDENFPDSGWRFFAGDEDEEFTNSSKNFDILSLNTVCNIDLDIIPYIYSEIGSKYIRIDDHNFKIDDNKTEIYIKKGE